MADLTFAEIALRFAGLIALLYCGGWLFVRYGERLDEEPARKPDADAFPPERSGVVRRDGMEERERKVAGE